MLEQEQWEYPIKIMGMLAGKKYYCAWCSKEVTGFRDRLSAQEYRISQTCQECQDEVFGKEEYNG